jgi:hypothetical protein
MDCSVGERRVSGLRSDGGWPFKADSPLIIYSDAVLSFAIAFKGLEAITRKVEISQGSRRIQLIELPPAPLTDERKSLASCPLVCDRPRENEAGEALAVRVAHKVYDRSGVGNEVGERLVLRAR